METKVCKKCGDEKPLGEFHQKLDTVDGRDHRCKACKGVKGVDRRKRPAVIPAELWMSTYIYRWTCLCCDSWESLDIVVGKQRITEVSSMEEAKSFARQGEIICATCDHTAVRTLKQRIKSKRRAEIVEERIKEADALAEVYVAAPPQSKRGKRITYLLERSTHPDHIEGELLDIAAEKFEQRHLSNHRRKELDATLPYQNEFRQHNVGQKEFTNFNFLYGDGYGDDE